MSFLPESDRFPDFLRASLGVMQSECSPAYNRLCELLIGRQVRIAVDGEDAALRFYLQHVEVLPEAPEAPAATMRLSRRTILDLVDGAYSLQDGILEGRVLVQGSPEELLLFFDGLQAYLRGAARCPSFPYLLERFRYATNTITAEHAELAQKSL